MDMTDKPALTNTVGYYNGRNWVIQINISIPTMSFYLKPGEYILNAKGQKVNDPLFESYAEHKQLCRETSEKQVPIIHLYTPTAPTAKSDNVGYCPVKSSTHYTQDSKGCRVPVLAPVVSKPVPTMDHNPVVSMSMEDARKKGLVRKIREVPEDYGQTDSQGGPARSGPDIKYSIDSGINKPVAPLNKELTTAHPSITDKSKRDRIVESMLKATSSVEYTETAPAAPTTNTEAATTVVHETAQADVANSTELPQPSLAESGQTTQPVTPVNKFKCPICGKAFKFHSQVERHIEKRHSESVTPQASS
jgi:hypothetical protein